MTLVIIVYAQHAQCFTFEDSPHLFATSESLIHRTGPNAHCEML
jgi:hypothetical protein